jgi:hypothetical protein
MAAPLGMFENEASRFAFERVLYLAERLASLVVQGIRLEDLRSAYQGLSMSAPVLPAISERVTFVQPETHAATIGYAASRRAVEGLYGIVDIGAGTTDISFFRLGRQGKQLAYYSTDTVPLGGDYVDRLILDELATRLKNAGGHSSTARAELLERIRIRKQQFRGPPLGLGHGLVLAQREFDKATTEVGMKLFEQYRRTWWLAYQKEKRQTRWRDGFTLFLIGGGSELGPTVVPLCATPDKQFVNTIRVERLALPDGITADPPNRSQEIRDYSKLLMVAYGLAHHVAESPDFFLPKEVEPLSPPEHVRVAWDDLEKEGQWW